MQIRNIVIGIALAASCSAQTLPTIKVGGMEVYGNGPGVLVLSTPDAKQTATLAVGSGTLTITIKTDANTYTFSIPASKPTAANSVVACDPPAAGSTASACRWVALPIFPAGVNLPALTVSIPTQTVSLPAQTITLPAQTVALQ